MVLSAIALNSSPGEEYVGATIGLFVFLPVVPAWIVMTTLQFVTPRVEDFRRDAVHFTANKVSESDQLLLRSTPVAP